MNRTSRFLNLFKYAALLGIGMLLLWLTFRNEKPADIFMRIRHAHWFYVTLSVIFGLAAFLIRAYRWNMLIEPLGYKARFSNAAYALGIGYFANLAIPRIGEITRCGTLGRADNIPFEKLIGTVITERIIDLIMLAFSILLVGFLQYDLLSGFLMDKIITPVESAGPHTGNHEQLWWIPAALGLVILIIFLFRNRLSALRDRILNFLKGIADGLKTILYVRNKVSFIFYTLLIWVLYFFATYICFYAFDSTAHLGVNEGMFILVAGGLGMSAPVQGGIGAYHYIVSQALQLFGISSTDGIAYATLVHTCQTILVILIGCISLFMIVRSKSQKQTEQNAL